MKLIFETLYERAVREIHEALMAGRVPTRIELTPDEYFDGGFKGRFLQVPYMGDVFEYRTVTVELRIVK